VQNSDRDEKRKRLRNAGTCRVWGTSLPAREDAIYERDTKTVRHTTDDPEGRGPLTANLGTGANIDPLRRNPNRGTCDRRQEVLRPRLKVEAEYSEPDSRNSFVGSRGCTRLVDGVIEQIAVVREHLDDSGAPGLVCLVEADCPSSAALSTTVA